MKVSEIIKRCNDLIPREVEYEDGEPYGAHNIPSTDMEVKKILYCVTPSPKVRKYFKENGYDLLISHHPFVAGVPQLIYHTALDCCKGGLNDMWADALGIDLATRKHFDKDLGWSGKLEKPMQFHEFVGLVQKFSGKLDGQIFSENGNFMIESVVICSGLGGLVSDLALQSNADVYVLGEAVSPAAEMGFKGVIETGHTNSEWQGVEFFKNLFKNDDIIVDGTPLEVDVYGTEYYRYDDDYGYCSDLYEYGV